MDESECLAMIQAAEENHVKLQVGFMRRFDASFQEAKKSSRFWRIGDVVMVKSLTHGPSEPKPWMFDIHKSNGPIGEVNSHDFDTPTVADRQRGDQHLCEWWELSLTRGKK